MTHLDNYKLVFLADQVVDKTSIITCFMYGNFDTNYQVRLLPISLHLHGSIGTHVPKMNQYQQRVIDRYTVQSVDRYN